MSEYVPCPLCKQYCHSIGGDQLAAAFNHFQTMWIDPGKGYPTAYCFDEQTRDAAQILMTAATGGGEGSSLRPTALADRGPEASAAPPKEEDGG